GDRSPRRSATEAESPKTAMARTGPFGGLAAVVIGADCTERPRAARCRGRRRLALSPLAADFEGDRVLAQLLAQRPPLFGGQAGATQAGTRRDRLGPHAGGGPTIGDVLSKQFGTEPGPLDFAHPTGTIGTGIETHGEGHDTQD